MKAPGAGSHVPSSLACACAGAVSRFQSLFRGLDRAHGEFRIQGRGSNGKVMGQGITVRAPATDQHWIDHLEGRQGLGIIPIMADNRCVWGCLDIDDRSIDHKALVKRIKELRLPLVVCRSKSGGAHAFLFLKEPVDCSFVRQHLIAWSAWLGHGGCEVFPKQTKLADANDVGNWLNLPYFDAERTTRYAIDPETGRALSLEEFLDLAEVSKTTADAILDIPEPTPEEDVLPDGPPCLQLLLAQGVGPGMRNEALFNLGVYYRLAQPESWEDAVEDANHKWLKPPLKSREVQAVIKSLQRKDYFYKCEEPPLRPLCNKALCRRRRFGVGQGLQVDVEITALTRIDTRPPVWYAEVDGERIQLTTEELASQTRFALRCMEKLGKWPTPMKPLEWQRRINQLMESMEIVEVPPESGPEGQFWDLLTSFLEAAGNQARRKDDLLLHHKVWREDGMAWFRSLGLIEWLKQHRFNELSQAKVFALLRSRPDIQHRQFNVKGRCVQVWGVPTE